MVLSLIVVSSFGQNQYIKKDDTNRSKAIVKSVNNKIKEFLSTGQIEEASAYIQRNMEQCKTLETKNLCVAGLNFTNGYLYQKAALQDTIRSSQFQTKAVRYYLKTLEVYPNNKAALTNLIKLNKKLGQNRLTIRMLNMLAEKYPSYRVKYLISIGDLYSDDKNFRMACNYYQKAYKEDPFSEEACGAMVELYTSDYLKCSTSPTIRQFALNCQNIEFPNYSEELLRKELTLAFGKQDYRTAMESLILWANVLAENGWLDSRQVDRLFTKLFPSASHGSPKGIYTALKELSTLLKINEAHALMDKVQFWNNNQPVARLSRDGNSIEPNTVLLKILHKKGQQAYFKGNFKNTAVFWNAVFDSSEYYNPTLYVDVASDLAQLYHKNPTLDPTKDKFNYLISRLFEMKSRSYRNGNKRMIRKLHITLGTIFYNQEMLGQKPGYRARNAKFQLEHALSENLGTIVNPKLRRMLGEIYNKQKEPVKSIDLYSLSIQDYLSLDQIKEADALGQLMKRKYRAGMNSKQLKVFTAVESIIKWRKNVKSSNNELYMNRTQVSTYLSKVTSDEKFALQSLPKKFVQVQFFKGLSDLGSRLSDTKQKDKQLIYANALEKIKDIKTLSSPLDFDRIKTIKIVLEKSVVHPKKLERTQVYKTVNNKSIKAYNTSRLKTDFKTYKIPTLNKEIVVPNQLFELNTALQKYYQINTTKEKANLKILDKKFVVIKQN